MKEFYESLTLYHNDTNKIKEEPLKEEPLKEEPLKEEPIMEEKNIKVIKIY